MAKISMIERNNKRVRLNAKHNAKREELKSIIKSTKTSPSEKMSASLKLADMPKNGSKTRIRNRCELTGRSQGYYRKFGLSRIEVRRLAAEGLLPGVTKASW